MREFLKSLGLPRPSHQLLSTIHHITRGLPLFIQEIVNHLIQKGNLQERKDHFVANYASIAMVSLPQDIQSAFAIRVKNLSETCRQTLTTASVLGEHFSLDRLDIVSNLHIEELLDALEEELHQRLIFEEEEAFQFSHALIRQAFYKELSAVRRRRIHLKIAQALEQMDETSVDEYLLEIAYHLVEAGNQAEPSQLVRYARRAGHQAFSIFAWSDAARYYEAALGAAKALDMSPQDMAELHYLAGLSHYRNTDVGPVLDHYDKAINLYRISGNIRELAKTLVEQTVTHITLSSIPLGTLADLQPLQEMLEKLGDDEPALRGRIATVMSQSYRIARQPEEARLMAENALEIGQSIQDDYLCADACTSLSLAHFNGMDVQAAFNSLKTAQMYASRTTDLILQSWPIGRLPLSQALLGNLHEAEESALQSVDFTIQTQAWGENSLAHSHLASIAVAKGHFEIAKQRAHETMLMVDRSLYPWGGMRALPALACACAMLGQATEAKEALDTLAEPGRLFASPDPVTQHFASTFRFLSSLYAEQPLHVSIESLSDNLLSVVSSDTYSLAPLCALIEIGAYTNTTAVIDNPYNLLLQALQGGALFTTGWIFLIPRILGVADACYQRWDKSAVFLLEAIEQATRADAKPELARSYREP